MAFRSESLQLLTLYLSTIGSLMGPSLDLVKFGKLSRWEINGTPLIKNKRDHNHTNHKITFHSTLMEWLNHRYHILNHISD